MTRVNQQNVLQGLVQGVLPLLSGLLFGAGLLLSGMSDPQKVLAFLDVAGAWNPALAFVMGGAILVTLPAFAYVRRRGQTVFADPAVLPARQGLNAPLLYGSVLFGLGWGLSGVCPGPGLLLAAVNAPGALIFVAAMLAGMALSDLSQRGRSSVSVEPPKPAANCG